MTKKLEDILNLPNVKEEFKNCDTIADEKIKYHRDGIGYIYSNDIDNNVIELVDRKS